jgi:hypothetical protein
MNLPAELCPHLQPLLDVELAAGNRIKDRGPSPALATARLVLLAQPFHAVPATLAAPLRLNQVNDPHWWLAECTCTEHGDVLACAFA